MILRKEVQLPVLFFLFVFLLLSPCDSFFLVPAVVRPRNSLPTRSSSRKRGLFPAFHEEHAKAKKLGGRGTTTITTTTSIITTSTLFSQDDDDAAAWDDNNNNNTGEGDRHLFIKTTTEPLLTTSANNNNIVIASCSSNTENRKRDRFLRAIPGTFNSTAMDKLVLATAVPSMVNLAVVPLVQAVDTFWVGRMGVALALAGQAAANQAFFTIFFLVNFLPTITAPLVASAVGSGNEKEAKDRVCESLFLSNLLGAIGTAFLFLQPSACLQLLLPANAPAMQYATPYLRFRALSMIPALISATGFAAFRGMLDTVTPLKISLAANLVNLFLDPFMIFKTPLGFVGAAAATASAELFSGLLYLKLLVRRKFVSLRDLATVPSLKTLIPLIQGGLSMLGRQVAINVALITAARRAQVMDPSGVLAAAYGIVMQLNSLGIVMHIAMQGTAAALVPSSLAKSGENEATQIADRVFMWGSLLGLLLGVGQYLALPVLVPLFSTLPEVQSAVRIPALLASLLHVVNGPVFVGEGILLGLGNFRDLMVMTGIGTLCLSAALCSPLGTSLNGIMISLIGWSSLQAVAVLYHYLIVGRLAVKSIPGNAR